MIRALIVDDEAPARMRLRRLLGEQAIEVVGEAADGEEAMHCIAALGPDLVFLDIQMPGLTGLEVASRLAPPRPRVVFCTAFDEFAIEAFEHHAIDYLLKPVNRQRLAKTLARVGSELAEVRRRAREEDEAARAQARLMPETGPDAGGLDCAAICRPAGRIGGDYYDVRPLAGGRVVLAVGDVSGKGPYAGLLVAALQARLQAVVEGGTQDPARALAEVNRLTVGTWEEHRFATLFLGVYDRERRSLECSSAGHPPALLVGADGRIREIGAGGPAIGWPGGAFSVESVLVAPGDTLVAYSDGVTEALDPSGEEFGLRRLLDAIGDPARASARETADRVMAALASFCGDRAADDDRTLLVARVRP
jgi:sigma-B regulation protein RsbU (phosphoserine phosphatase)